MTQLGTSSSKAIRTVFEPGSSDSSNALSSCLNKGFERFESKSGGVTHTKDVKDDSEQGWEIEL